jgi:glycosyltransferase involved in cell wall biosynthesis
MNHTIAREKMPSIALTTICLNAAATIEQSFDSVAAQSGRADEYIIVDGGSSDGTVDMLKAAQADGLVTRFISEADRGISDAFNKAWRATNCDYVATLNADDRLAPDYLKHVRRVIAADNPDIVISHIFFGSDKKAIRIRPRIARALPPASWAHPAINHPGMVIRKALLEKLGGYSEDYQIAMDVDLFYKMLSLTPKITIIDAPLVHQGGQGVSQKKWRRALYEMRQIEVSHGRNRLAAFGAYYARLAKGSLKRLILAGRN